MLMPIHLLSVVFDVIYQGLNWQSLVCTKLPGYTTAMYLSLDNPAWWVKLTLELFGFHQSFSHQISKSNWIYLFIYFVRDGPILNVDPSLTFSYFIAKFRRFHTCKTGNWGDAERVWNRQATCPHHYVTTQWIWKKQWMIWRYQAWAASHTHFSWLYMRVCWHSAAHRLTW